MPFTVSVPVSSPEDFDKVVSLALDREKVALASLGAKHAAELAAAAAKELIKSWDVAGDPDRTFGATLSGHANPNGEAPEGFGNDEITVTVWRSGNRPPDPARDIKEAVAAALKEHDAKAAKADAKAERQAEAEKADAKQARADKAAAAKASETYVGAYPTESIKEG